jgi:hypothetical protein
MRAYVTWDKKAQVGVMVAKVRRPMQNFEVRGRVVREVAVAVVNVLFWLQLAAEQELDHASSAPVVLALSYVLAPAPRNLSQRSMSSFNTSPKQSHLAPSLRTCRQPSL